MPSNHLILCRPLLLLPSTLPNIRVFSNESALPIRWPKCWIFNFNISLSNEHPGLISFRMDWLDITAVQETLQSFLQHQNSKYTVKLTWLDPLGVASYQSCSFSFYLKRVKDPFQEIIKPVNSFISPCYHYMLPNPFFLGKELYHLYCD